MVTLALDQSTKKSGYSIWKDNTLIAHGVMDSEIEENDYIKRIRKTSELIEQLIDKYNPDFAVIEGTQYQNNLNVYHQLSCNQGSIMKIMFDRNIDFTICPVNTWRSYNEIKGNKKRTEQKKAAIALVEEVYGIQATDDECEAILIGRYATEKLLSKEN